MGTGQSSLVSAPAPTKAPDVLLKDEIHTKFTSEITLEDFKKLVEAAKNEHGAILLTFNAVKQRIESGADTIALGDKTALDRMKEQFGDNDDKKKAHIETLYNINAIYDEYVPESKEADKRKVKVFDDFDLGYRRYVDMLELMFDTKDIAMDDAALVDKSIPGLKEDRENAQKVINQYLTRIIYLTYCIVHNDYVSMIYTMFAVRLFRTFDMSSIVAKKRNEFKGIVDKLQGDLNTKIETIKTEHADMIAHSDKSSGQMLENVKNMKQTAGGADTAPDQSRTIYEDIVELHRDKLNMYTLSNNFLKTYIEMINDILVGKLNELSNRMKEAESRNVVVSEHLRRALNEIKTNSKLLDEKRKAQLNSWRESVRFGEPLSAEEAREFDNYMNQTATFAKMTDDEKAQYKVWLADMMLRREYKKLTSEIANISNNTLEHMNKNPTGVDKTAKSPTASVTTPVEATSPTASVTTPVEANTAPKAEPPQSTVFLNPMLNPLLESKNIKPKKPKKP